MAKIEINNYKDHQAEKERLSALLQIQGNQIKTDVAGLKTGFQPIHDVVASVGKFSTNEGKRTLLYAGVDISMALLTKKFIVTKSTWFNDLALPILVRSLSNEPVDPKKDGDAFDVIIEFIKKWIVKRVPALQ